MKIEQLYTGCLAEAAYYLESEGEAAIVDPLREAAPYLALLQERGARLKYIFETHFHADFVSGHLDLAHETGAQIIYGPGAAPDYPIYRGKDGERFALGRAIIELLHTPGHTPESSCFLLIDEEGKEKALLTGDTLFIGDVGRPDLAAGGDVKPEERAGQLYDSIQQKILPLADDVIIYPGHGAGSACGKQMSHETYDTLGHQKQVNYALRAGSKAEFIEQVLDGISEPPAYFAQNVSINRKGYESYASILQRGLTPLSPDILEEAARRPGTVLLDTRDAEQFKQAFIPGSIHVGLDGSFASWVGSILEDVSVPILLLCEEGQEAETIQRLARVGCDQTLGYLQGGISAWKKAGKAVAQIESIPAQELKAKLPLAKGRLLDVRKAAEFESGHLPEAVNVPLAELPSRLAEVEPEQLWYVYCAGGYRSAIAASLLHRHGMDKLVDVRGGYQAVERAG